MTLVLAEEPPELPVTIRFVVPAAMLAAVWMVRVLVMLPLAGTVTCAGLKPQVTPVTAPHERVTVPVKLVPLLGATVMVVVVLDPAETLAGVKAPAASSHGAAGMGRPLCSAKTVTNRINPPYDVRNWMIWLMLPFC